MEKTAKQSQQSLPAPGCSGSFRISLKSPTPTDPGMRLAELAQSTQALSRRLSVHERFNSHLDAYLKGKVSDGKKR